MLGDARLRGRCGRTGCAPRRRARRRHTAGPGRSARSGRPARCNRRPCGCAPSPSLCSSTRHVGAVDGLRNHVGIFAGLRVHVGHGLEHDGVGKGRGEEPQKELTRRFLAYARLLYSGTARAAGALQCRCDRLHQSRHRRNPAHLRSPHRTRRWNSTLVARADRALRRLPPHFALRPRALAGRRRRNSGGRAGPARPHHDARDGQAHRRRPRAKPPSAPGLPLLRGARRAPAGRRGRRHRRRPQLHPLPADRPGAGGHALELPLLAGVPLRRARR